MFQVTSLKSINNIYFRAIGINFRIFLSKFDGRVYFLGNNAEERERGFGKGGRVHDPPQLIWQNVKYPNLEDMSPE